MPNKFPVRQSVCWTQYDSQQGSVYMLLNKYTSWQLQNAQVFRLKAIPNFERKVIRTVMEIFPFALPAWALLAMQFNAVQPGTIPCFLVMNQEWWLDKGCRHTSLFSQAEIRPKVYLRRLNMGEAGRILGWKGLWNPENKAIRAGSEGLSAGTLTLSDCDNGQERTRHLWISPDERKKCPKNA